MKKCQNCDNIIEESRTYCSVKEIVIATLLENGIINEEQASEYVNNWQVIIFKRSWFERWANFFKKDDLNAYQYKFVKFESNK
jgi:hypothetical protein